MFLLTRKQRGPQSFPLGSKEKRKLSPTKKKSDQEVEIIPIRPSRFSGDHVPVEFQQKTGELINRWAYIEYQLKVIIRVSLGITRAVQNLLLHNRDLRQLCELVKQISEAGTMWVPDADLRDEILKLADDVAKGSSVRNDYAHGVFAIPEKGTQAGKFSRYLYQKIEHKLHPNWQPLQAGDLDPMIKKAIRLGARAQNATVKLKELKK